MIGAVAAAVLVAGVLIGATGIGGVLVVPTLTQLGGIDIGRSIAAAAAAFALPGAAALAWLRRSGAWTPRWNALLLGAVPAAAAGALMVHAIDRTWLFAGVSTLALLSGARGLLQMRHQSVTVHSELVPEPRAAALFALGVVVGFGSALTGTGGPVLLVPTLLLTRQPLARTVAAAQAIQLPVALCAGAAHAYAGALDWSLALVLGVLLLAGSVGGQRALRVLPIRLLQAIVSVLLLGVGGWFGLRALSAMGAR